VEADETAKIFMAKWGIKDGFWRLNCVEGEEYNFAYILPQPEEEPIQIVISTSLQMGWVESPPYFCAAKETARDVAEEYIKMPVSSLHDHKFVKYTNILLATRSMKRCPLQLQKLWVFYTWWKSTSIIS
jgi:hypothetical protein